MTFNVHLLEGKLRADEVIVNKVICRIPTHVCMYLVVETLIEFVRTSQLSWSDLMLYYVGMYLVCSDK